MEYVRLGATGLEVSRIGLGCMTFGEPGRGITSWSLGEAESTALIRQAVEAGVNFFDTANFYSMGSSEEIVGRALREHANRDEMVIATKVFFPMREGPNAGGLSRKAIMSEVDHSLRRLGTDYIDLYQIHRADRRTPWEETLGAFDDLVRAGKVRYLGASSMPAWEFAKARQLQERHGWSRFVSMQDHYNLLAREEEREMHPLCLDKGVGVIPWSPLARGKLARPAEAKTARSAADRERTRKYYSHEESDRLIQEAVASVAAEHGASQAAVALAWLRHQPVVAAPIVGVTKPEQLEDAVASVGLRLNAEELLSLEAPYTPRENHQALPQ